MRTLLTLFIIVSVISLLTCPFVVSAAITRHSQQFVEYVETVATETLTTQIPKEDLQLASEINSLAQEFSNKEIQDKLLETSRLLREGNTAEAINNYQELMDYATSLLESGELNVEEYGKLLRILSQMTSLVRELPVNQQIALRNYYASYLNSLSDKLYYEGVVNNDIDLIKLARELKDLSYALKSGEVSLSDIEKTLNTLEKLSSKKQVVPETLENIDQDLKFLKNIVLGFPKHAGSTLLPESSGLSSFVKNYVGSLKIPSITMPSVASGFLVPDTTTLMYIGAIIAVMVLTYFLIVFFRKFGVKVSARKIVEKIVYKAKHEIKAKTGISGVVEAYWYTVGVLSKLIPRLDYETHREYLRKISMDEVKGDFEKLTFLYEKDRFSKTKASEKETIEAVSLARKIESNVLKRI